MGKIVIFIACVAFLSSCRTTTHIERENTIHATAKEITRHDADVIFSKANDAISIERLLSEYEMEFEVYDTTSSNHQVKVKGVLRGNREQTKKTENKDTTSFVLHEEKGDTIEVTFDEHETYERSKKKDLSCILIFSLCAVVLGCLSIKLTKK